MMGTRVIGVPELERGSNIMYQETHGMKKCTVMWPALLGYCMEKFDEGEKKNTFNLLVQSITFEITLRTPLTSIKLTFV